MVSVDMASFRLENTTSFRKRYCTLGLGLELVLVLGLAGMCFQSNVLTSKCSRIRKQTDIKSKILIQNGSKQ